MSEEMRGWKAVVFVRISRRAAVRQTRGSGRHEIASSIEPVSGGGRGQNGDGMKVAATRATASSIETARTTKHTSGSAEGPE